MEQSRYLELKALIEQQDIRINNLETIIMSNKLKKSSFNKVGAKNEPNLNKYAGLKGGIILLVSEDFFRVKKNVKEVSEAMNAKGYTYGISQIQTALNRLSGARGMLVKLVENSKKVYVNRK